MASFYTGNSGSSTGEHLDFRVWDVAKGQYTDPTRFAGRMRVGDRKLTDDYGVTSNYGMREHPTKGGQRMHHGIDYAPPSGTEVTIDGGQFLTTFNDKAGGGITSQYGITDEDGGKFEILLMHGNDKNKVLSDGARTDGAPTIVAPPTDSDVEVAPETKAAPPNYATMSKSQMNAEYDKVRKAGDVFAANKAGKEMHKAYFKK